MSLSLHDFSWWPYVMPPIAGAVIGYFTNYLAIRMLFRPLTKKYFLGLPVPLTPGIIPARRRDLAIRLADMVGDHLLTRTVILRRLQSTAVDDALYRWVTERFNRFIETDFGTPATLIPETLQPAWRAWGGRGWRPAYQVIDWAVSHPDLRLLLRTPITELTRYLLTTDLKYLIPNEIRQQFKKRLPLIIHEGLQSQPLRVWLESEIDRLGELLLASDKPLGEILPADLQTALLTELHRELPNLMVHFSRLLYDPDIRQRLKQRIHQGINVYIDNMGFWRRLVTSMALSDEEIQDKISQLVDDVAKDLAISMQQPEWQEKVFNMLAERLAVLLSMSPAQLSGRLSFSRVSRGWAFIKKRLLDHLTAGVWSERLAQIIYEFMEPLGQKSLADLFVSWGLESVDEKIAEQLGNHICRVLRSRQVKRRLAVVLALRFDQWFNGWSVGSLSQYLPGTLNKPLIDFFYQQAQRHLAEELPRLSENFAVKNIVEERINQLPVIKV
ncbi:MAG: DUF445 family protein, partial [Deltaproteobacteria bacterium]|nr:DUF445 family protein [Candidatus Tharpella sp.]